MLPSSLPKFAPASYLVGREKIREYAAAVGDSHPLHLDVEAARAAGHVDLVAPPMFAVVYAGPAIWPALTHPDMGIDFARLVHGAQAFEWNCLVVAGDEITTRVELVSVEAKGPLEIFTFETRSANERGESTCVGRWTNIVRGKA